ncbi:WD40-repeat-containing domain protein, partial [Cladochytrium replicatum]
GAVLCTRFDSESGRLLASGSDDTKIVIWELNESAGAYGNLIGLGDDGSRNKETWKAKMVFVGHDESDVTDLAWSPDNTMLSSCVLDSAIHIWSAKSFERLHKIVIQKGFVKGLTWDPVGNFFAAQSDDNHSESSAFRIGRKNKKHHGAIYTRGIHYIFPSVGVDNVLIYTNGTSYMVHQLVSRRKWSCHCQWREWLSSGDHDGSTSEVSLLDN